MKKTKILSAVLSVVMMASAVVMSGCGNKSLENQNNETNASVTSSTRQPVTLNMFIKTNDSTDPDAARRVQMAINEITVPKHKTTIKINYLKEADYWAAVDAAEKEAIAYEEEQKAIEEEKAAAKKEAYAKMTPEERRKADKEEKRKKEEEEKKAAQAQAAADAEFNELIDEIYESEDITLEKPQIDIFFSDSAEKLFELIADNRVEPLNTYIDYESKVLKSYIYPTFLATAKIDGKYYGVPSNDHIGGVYEYLVFDKALLDKYDVNMDDITEIREMKDYLATIKANEHGVIPLTKPTSLSGWEYFGGEVGAFGIYKSDTSTGWDTDLHPIFSDERYFLRHLESIQDYKKNGYFADSYPAGSRFAIDVRQSETCPEEEFEENGRTYVTYIYKLPRATAENVLDTCWVVSAYSKNKARAMEMITLFNTNAELSNLLRYGISNVNYYYDDMTDTIEIVNDSYSMDPAYTGNRYLQYTTIEEKEYADKAKAHNLYTVPHPFIAFRPELSEEDLEVLAQADEIARKYMTMIENGQMSVADAFAQGKAETEAIEEFKSVANGLAGDYSRYVSNVSAGYAIPPIVTERLEKKRAINEGTYEQEAEQEAAETEQTEEATEETVQETVEEQTETEETVQEQAA